MLRRKRTAIAGARSSSLSPLTLRGRPIFFFLLSCTIVLDCFISFRVQNNQTEGKRDTQMQKTETRKLRTDLTAEQREQAERIGSLPTGQRIKTAWSMRVEHFIPSQAQH